jgi:hypothetical protein
MASTYSSNLKIELMAAGEQNNTWGSTTNVNLGTALEEAIVGYGNPNFTSDADLTISLSNSNAAQTARNFVLNVTSSLSLTSTWNLVVPTIEKPYVVQNNTTGGQSIVVKTAAGTGITVPNGKKVFVYVNGTNVVSAIDYFPTLAAGSFVGPLTGNADTATTATNATNINISATTSSDTTTSVVLVGSQATGNQAPFIDSGLTYNADTNTLTATTFNGSLATTNWTVSESGGTLYFKYSGVNKASLDSSGNLTVVGNVTAYGTVS